MKLVFWILYKRRVEVTTLHEELQNSVISSVSKYLCSSLDWSFNELCATETNFEKQCGKPPLSATFLVWEVDMVHWPWGGCVCVTWGTSCGQWLLQRARGWTSLRTSWPAGTGVRAGMVEVVKSGSCCLWSQASLLPFPGMWTINRFIRVGVPFLF